MSKNIKLNDEEVYVLKDIITKHLSYYLDEISLALLVRCSKLLYYFTLQHYITSNLNYSLQTIIASAKQQCGAEQEFAFKNVITRQWVTLDNYQQDS